MCNYKTVRNILFCPSYQIYYQTVSNRPHISILGCLQPHQMKSRALEATSLSFEG